MSSNPNDISLKTNNSVDIAITDYPKGTGILAFRDLEQILIKHVSGANALDFGCGTGRSSRILQSFGYNVCGVDISESMLKQARDLSTNIEYLFIDNNFEVLNGKSFNLILISFVFMEIDSKSIIIDKLQKLSRLLADNGKIVVITTTDEFYSLNWLSIKNKYKANTIVNSGQLVEIELIDYGIKINDHYWSENDCDYFFHKANLNIVSSYYPLGRDSDCKNWIDEKHKSPFVIYVLEVKK